MRPRYAECAECGWRIPFTKRQPAATALYGHWRVRHLWLHRAAS